MGGVLNRGYHTTSTRGTQIRLTLSVGVDGKIYSGSWDHTIRMWSGVDGAHLQTLECHTDLILSLAAGVDGKIYWVS